MDLGQAVSVPDLAPEKDPDPSDRKDVSASDLVFHLGATVRFPVLDSI